MFSFQQSEELVFHKIPSLISFQQQARNQQDHHLMRQLHDNIIMESNTYIHPVTKSKKRHEDQSSSSKPNSATIEAAQDEQMQRKLVHREIERQRRQDMAKLYALLRDLLPLEFLKGKRSTSDHMHQAVNYVKHLQENIRVLSVKRDRLKNLVETSVPRTGTNTCEKSLMNVSPNTVSVSSNNGRIQILIHICDDFPISRILKVILEGLNIITYTCTKVNYRLVHTIQTEANDPAVSTDHFMLQQRLFEIANNN
ncbi:transcription factor bHLH118-like [Bidens hawaiensis]|uniref:transcription factor bHLH118-like n=1 Tax=Bidens hawaiensis TaxID=980011 RepID=UPI0040494BBF